MKSKKRLQRRFALLLSLMLGLSVLVVDRYNVTAIENEENQEQVTEEIMNSSETTQNQVQDAQDAVEQVDEDVKVEDESVNLSLRAEEVVVYVSNAVTDDQAPKGSAENPYSSLAEAVQAINTQEAMDAVIELMSDLTATECARINGKNITIHGNGHTITRGTEFASISDNARSWYNPAMIEVCNSSSSATASLYLESITLDDNGITAGTRYDQATTNGNGGNTDTVQDAIIATYDGVGTIILGNNTTLTGYAGMSAVRLSGGTLIMESGSLITGGKVFTTKGGGNGPAGAIWSQGGRITINNGASIDQIQGRAIYLDGQGSEAFVNGTISNVIANNNMWQGSDGTAMHIRNKSSVVLGETGHIHHVDGGSAVISVVQSSFEAKAGSLMSDTSNTQLMNIDNYNGLTTNRVYLDGEVKDCTYGDVLFRAWYYRYEIGPNANIHNTTAKTRSIGMFYLQNGGELNVHGKIQDNNNTVVYMGNQGGSDTYVRVYDGGYIHNNSGYGIYANNSGQVEIYGGEISENSSYGVYVRAKNNWKNPTLKMTGGKIINNNSCGIYYITVADSPRSLIDITGVEISGNSSTYQVAISGANAKDAISRIYIKEGVVKAGNGKTDDIYTSFGTLSSIEQNGDLYLGNAKSEASNLLKELVKDYKEGNDDLNDYKTKGSALWFKAEADTLKFEVKPSSINVNLPLYVAYIPLKADGTPTDDAQVVILPVVNDAQVVIELKNLEPQQSYALMWMQPSEKFGSIGITGDTEIYEELGVHHYNVDYKVTYSLSNDMKPLLSAGHEFTVDIQLDKRLAYDPQVGEITLPEKSVFEIVSTVYDQQAHSLKVGLKLKDGFTAYSKAELSFTASADFDEFVDAIFESDASLSSSLVLSGDSISTPFTLATVRPATTHFIPLFMHRVDYTGGSETVKEGTALSVDTDGGVMEIECPDKVMEDIVLPDPTKEGYVFVGWEVEREETSISFKALYHEIYTVTFVDYDDTVLAVVEVEAGNSAIAPENPIREGYRFVGWDTSFTNVQSDLTVKALYHQLFTVTFVDYDDTVLAVVEVEAGHAAIAPQNPTREGYAFVRWDRNFTNVQSDLVVHALYERIPVFYTVSFVDYDGSILDQQLIEEGHKAVAPNDPTREGYTFIGWDVAFDDVQSDLTVTAMYEEVEAPVVIVDPETPQTPQQPTPTPTPTPQPEIPEPVIPLVPVTPEPEPEPEPTPGPVELPDPDTPLSPSEGN